MICRKPQEIRSMNSEQQEPLLRRAAQAGLAAEDVGTIRAIFESYAYVSELIEHKQISLDRLRKMLFGAQTEKTAEVTGRQQADSSTPASAAAAGAASIAPESSNSPCQATPTGKKGHGR